MNNKVRFSITNAMIAEKIHVVGVTFKNTDSSDRQYILEGLLSDIDNKDYDNVKVLIKHEIDNEFDPDALAVFVQSSTTNGQVGYLPKEDSFRLRNLYENGLIKSINISSVGRGSNNKIGIELEFIMDSTNI